MGTFKLSDLFSFDKQRLTMHMMYEMRLGSKIKKSFDYVIDKLSVQKLKKDLNDLKWSEGKNYDWAAVKSGDIIFLIRQYRSHSTIFFKNTNKERDYRSKYGCFTINVNRDMLTDDQSDERCDNRLMDLNSHIEALIKLVADDKQHMLWNDLVFKREKYIEVKSIWTGGDDISDIDGFMFCYEEISHKYLELFAENDMLAKLKTLKKGDSLNGGYEVVSVRTDVKDDYYHDAGIEFKHSGKTDWADVYSLSRYYLEMIFGEIELNTW